MVRRSVALLWFVALATPVAVFALLRAHPSLDRAAGSGTSHFVIVTAVAAMALVLALAVLWAARSVPDARALVLAMGFLAMAGLFFAHGAGTGPFWREAVGPAPPAPAVAADPARRQASATTTAAGPAAGTDGYHDAGGYGYAGAYGAGGYGAAPAPTGAEAAAAHRHADAESRARGRIVGFSARLSLLVSALCFALATMDLPRRLADAVARRRLRLTILFGLTLAGYVVLALFAPTRLLWIPMTERANWGVAAVTWCALALAGWRFFEAYRYTALPLQGTMALGMALLAQAQWFMLRGPVWHLSWWTYHVTMLAGFLAPVIGLLWQYRTAGDLGAVVEGLFLRRAVAGLRAGDPHALTALAAAVAAKDSETSEHVERVGELAVALGRRLGLPEERLEVLRWAGRLHDLGKIGVPNNILRKPGPLTPAEYRTIQQHSPRGWRVAARSKMLERAAPLIRWHHERMDGRGYPDGLRGEAIPLEARIIAVADVWDALTCDRPYRKAMSPAEAAAIVARESGPGLDPRCVQALFAELGLVPNVPAVA